MAIDEQLSSMTGLPTDQVRLVAGNLLCILLCYYMPLVPTVSARFLYSTILGTILQTYIYCYEPWRLLFIFICNVIIYVLISRLDRRNIGRTITYLTMIILSSYHIYRLLTDYGSWRIDVATFFMMVVCKYSSFAYAYEDGAKSDEVLTADQKLNKLVSLPSFWQYISYIQFLPTAALGPTLYYRYFERYMNQYDQYGRIPSTVGQATKSFLEAIFWITIYMSCYPMFPLSHVSTYEFYNRSSWYGALYIFVCLTFMRAKYYFAWKLSSTSIDACGLSYGGSKMVDGKEVHDWSLIPTVNPYMFYTSMHFREKVKSWNMSVQSWLEKCIYVRYRTPEEYKKNPSARSRGQLLVLLTSAFWHGFYAGYYLSFFFWFHIINITNTIFRWTQKNAFIDSLFRKTGIVGRFIAWAVVSLSLTYFGTYFQLLSFPNCYSFMKSSYFIPNIVLVILSLTIPLVPIKDTKKVNKAKYS